MLGIYEKRCFENNEKVWQGRYRDLSNVLHWHFECELIRIVDGCAQIKIENSVYHAVKNDCFFCNGEELHYIIGFRGSIIEAMIFDESLTKDICQKYTLISPKLNNPASVEAAFLKTGKILAEKGVLYRPTLENCARGIILDIFNVNPIQERSVTEKSYRKIIDKISNEYSYITFEECARYCGYSPSHFSKVFKKLSGLTFSEYLNIIKVENAIMLLCNNETNLTVTDISSKCGFSTVRNFNRVFKSITGFSPTALPKDFVMQERLKISKNDSFDPTNKESKLLLTTTH